MANKTVAVYDTEEFENNGITDAITTEKGRRSVLLPLILSLIAAVGLWLFVLGSNNTVSDVQIDVLGTEQLMGSNFSVGAIDPPVVDMVLRGDAAAISRIKKDKTLIAASVNVYGTPSDRVGSYIFGEGETVKEGKYTVTLDIRLPDGVECSSKTVEVTIVPSASVVFDKTEIIIDKTNYSFANGFSLAGETVNNQTVTVIGDQETVSAIDHITLNIDWLKDIAGDVDAMVVPVAYDMYGGKIDSRFLRFEPEQVSVSISVNRKKTVSLALMQSPSDRNSYQLSTDTVTLFGPASYVDLLSDVLYINEDQDFEEQPEIAPIYTVDATSFGGKLRFCDNETDTLIKTMKIEVTQTTKTVEQSILIPLEDLQIKTTEDYDCVVHTSLVELQFRYIATTESVVASDILLYLDLSELREGTHLLTPAVFFKSGIDAKDIEIIYKGTVEVTLTVETAKEV